MLERIRKIVERWYVAEPALFQIYVTHNPEECRAMACAFRCGRGKIEYNPDLLAPMSDGQVAERLKAEIIRILLKHPYERQPSGCSRLAMGLGSALALADNYDFTTLKLPQPAVFGLPAGEAYEWYAYRIEDMLPKGGDQADGLPEDMPAAAVGDAAALWAEDLAMACAVDLAVEEINSSSTGWGSLDPNLVSKIVANTEARIDYRRVLGGFRASVLSSRRRLTRMRPNRRSGFENMGSIRQLSTRLLVAVDVSGSIDSQMLRHFYSVVNRTFKYGVESIDVVQFDVNLKDVVPMRKAKVEVEIKGRGGTDFQPVIEYVARHGEYDGVLIFTDGEAPVPTVPKGFRAKVVWVCPTEAAYNRHKGWMRTIGRCCFVNS